MKKREMVLDFTSLLDVILILLFLVVCSMNITAKQNAEAMDALAAQNETLTGQLSLLEEEAEELKADAAELEQNLSEASNEFLKAQQENQALIFQNEKLQETAERSLNTAEMALQRLEELEELSGLNVVDRTQYEIFLEKVTRVELVCIRKGQSCQVTILVNDIHRTSVLVGTEAASSEEFKVQLKDILASDDRGTAIISMVYVKNSMLHYTADWIRSAVLSLAEEMRPEPTIWFEEVTELTE